MSDSTSPQVPQNTPDSEFPNLTVHQANLMRSHLQDAIRSHGGEITSAESDQVGVRRGDGQDVTLGLDNLSLHVATLNTETEIRDAVFTFTSAVLAEGQGESLSDEDFYRQLKLRLLSADFRKQTGDNYTEAVVQEFCPGLDCYLTIDGDATVRTVGDEEARSHDDPAQLWKIARQNLWQELNTVAVSAEGVEFEESPAAPIWIAESSSYFLASAPLFGSEFLSQWFPNLDQSRGVILAMPHRHLMLAREVTTGVDLLNAMHSLLQLSLSQFQSQPGPISPHLHLYHGGEVFPFTTVATDEDGGGTIQIAPNDYLLEMLNHSE